MIFLFLLGIALSQLYVFESGIPQPAHYILALAMAWYLIKNGLPFLNKHSEKGLLPIYFFLFYQLLVNVFFYLMESDFLFLVQSIYLVYGIFLFLALSHAVQKYPSILAHISTWLILSLLTLFAAAILGYGEYKFSPRYNGFFNDPNQMAFWILCTTSLIFLSGVRISIGVIVFLVSAFLIFKTASRSGMVGLIFLTIGFLFSQSSKTRKAGFVKLFVYLIISIACLYFLVILFNQKNEEFLNFVSGRLENTDMVEHMEIRGYYRLMKYPEFLVFGAGHGKESRFSYEGTEIHSSWVGILFYYGFVGFIAFIWFLYEIVRKLSWSERFLFFSPIFYSFSTFGLRTPIFWIFISIFYAIASRKIKWTPRKGSPCQNSCLLDRFQTPRAIREK